MIHGYIQRSQWGIILFDNAEKYQNLSLYSSWNLKLNPVLIWETDCAPSFFGNIFWYPVEVMHGQSTMELETIPSKSDVKINTNNWSTKKQVKRRETG